MAEHNLNYTILDIDDSEINKAFGSHFTKIVHDITDLPLNKKYDLIFSHMVLEHIPDPNRFHESVLKMMHDNSTVIHFFATKYGLPSLANLILPSFISDFIIFKKEIL